MKIYRFKNLKVLSEKKIYQSFDGIKESISTEMVEIYFDDGTYLETTYDHQIYCQNNTIKIAKDLVYGDYVISKNGFCKVIYKNFHNKKTKVYDLINVQETHNFYANNKLVHNCVYLDEFAFVPNDVKFYESTYPVIASGETTKILITSTPNGMNLFYKIWIDAVNKRNEYIPIKYTWEAHPNRDIKWKEQTIKNTSQKQFKQEHLCEFLGSSNTLISSDKLEKLIYEEPIEYDENNFLYEKTQENHIYIACVDVSEGVGRDYSTIIIIDISVKPYKQVYVFKKNNISPWNFGEIIYRVCKKYNDAYLIIERNNIGKLVADELYYDYEYENMFSSITNKGEEIIAGQTLVNIGIQINKKTKSIGCSALKILIEEDILNICDWDTIQELTCFVKKQNSYQAEKNKYDDLVMPLVHFGWFTTQNIFEEITEKGVRQVIREKIQENSNILFGYFSDGTENL